MAIRFKYGNVIWETDTPDEAARLRQRLVSEDMAAWEDGEDLPNQGSATQEERLWTPDMVSDLVQNVGGLQLRFLKELTEHGSYVPSPTLLKKLSLVSEVSLAGVLSGLSKQLKKKLGLKPWNLYTVFVHWDGKSKSRSFNIGADFKRAADELGWPEKWNVK